MADHTRLHDRTRSLTRRTCDQCDRPAEFRDGPTSLCPSCATDDAEPLPPGQKIVRGGPK